MAVDPAARELYVADGDDLHRVIVFDAETGASMRHWGANGRPPGESGAKPFETPVHCVRLSRGGLVHVCDRRTNRIPVLRKDGTFVRESLGAQPGRRLGRQICTTGVDSGKRAGKFTLRFHP